MSITSLTNTPPVVSWTPRITTPSTPDPYQSFTANLQSLVQQMQDAANAPQATTSSSSLTQTAASSTGLAHHHHGSSGGGLLADLEADDSVSASTTSPFAAPGSDGLASSLASSAQTLGTAMQQAMQAYGAQASGPVLEI